MFHRIVIDTPLYLPIPSKGALHQLMRAYLPQQSLIIHNRLHSLSLQAVERRHLDIVHNRSELLSIFGEIAREENVELFVHDSLR